MSYSFSVHDGVAEDLRERAEKVAADCKASLGSNWVEEADGDVAAAIDAAERLALALADGAGGVPISVTISGHANAGRTPPQGWSTDMVTVTVSRFPVESPASAEGQPR